MRVFRILACALATLPLPNLGAAAGLNEIFTRSTDGGEKDWTKYLADNASASISAAGILDIAGDSVANVQNVRDFVVAVKGFSSDESKGTLALAITPARTSLSPMNLSTYAGSLGARVLGSVTLGYAQGDAELSGITYERRAVSAETNFFFDGDDDPVIAYARAVAAAAEGSDCEILRAARPSQLPGAAPPASAPIQPAAPSTPRGTPATPDAPAAGGAVAPAIATDAQTNAIKERAKKCRDGVMSKLRWNRSQLSVAYGTGWIKPTESGSEKALGKTLVIGLTYGFDRSPRLRDKLALAATYRRTEDEPILATLQNPTIDATDSSLAVVRLTFGSPKMRALAEFSDAESDNVTASKRAFKKAIGLDLRIYEATWLNLRFGEQRTIDGTDAERGSIFSISYSPSTLLK